MTKREVFRDGLALAIGFGVVGALITMSRQHWFAVVIGLVIALFVLLTVVAVGFSWRPKRPSAEALELLEAAKRARTENPEAGELLKALRAHLRLVREADDGKHEDLVRDLLKGMRMGAGHLESESDGADLSDACESLKSAAKIARKRLDEEPI
jgi:hypothetical protein